MEVTAIRERLHAVEQVMHGAMISGVHFGTIPGCGKKPTLLKPGAEILSMMFRLAPKLDTKIVELGGGHREYTVVCSMTHITTGDVWAQGIGSCCTMESKYRYRGAESEDTGKPVPKAYWDAKNAGDMGKAQSLLGGAGFAAKKSEAGGYTIHKKGSGKAENADIADVYNTCLKMAKKRAQIDATLSALGCSHLFTQDLEDMRPMASDDYMQPPPDATSQEAIDAMNKARQASEDEDLANFITAIEQDICARKGGKGATAALLNSMGLAHVRDVPMSARRDFYATLDAKTAVPNAQ
jgi:hypothetical protein